MAVGPPGTGVDLRIDRDAAAAALLGHSGHHAHVMADDLPPLVVKPVHGTGGVAGYAVYEIGREAIELRRLQFGNCRGNVLVGNPAPMHDGLSYVSGVRSAGMAAQPAARQAGRVRRIEMSTEQLKCQSSAE